MRATSQERDRDAYVESKRDRKREKAVYIWREGKIEWWKERERT